MKVKELYEIAKYSAIELHSGFDGKMVASSPKGVEKFADAEVLSIMPQIKVTKHSCDYARAYLYVFVDNNDVERIKMKHKAIRIDNLMYKGCEPHWKCTLCGFAVPFHCYTKEEFENQCCGCHKINCKNCDPPTEKDEE